MSSGRLAMKLNDVTVLSVFSSRSGALLNRIEDKLGLHPVIRLLKRWFVLQLPLSKTRRPGCAPEARLARGDCRTIGRQERGRGVPASYQNGFAQRPQAALIPFSTASASLQPGSSDCPQILSKGLSW